MGIGTPGLGGARGAGELVALSPGLLNMTPPPPSPQAGARGFPEPPPPPGAVEELSSGDWELSETPALAKTAPAAPVRAKATTPLDAAEVPESVDDFIEELPPSLPPPPEEESATPTINGSLRTAPFAAAEAPLSIDISSFDAPVGGSKTMPLFALGPSEPSSAPNAPPASVAALSAGAGAATLTAPPVERAARQAEPTESTRTRKNVVAPATNSVPPATPAVRRSGLAAPVLLVLAAAAGFLIWKRNASPPAEPVPRAEEPAAHVAEPATAHAPTPALAPDPAAPPANAAVAAPATDDDITFETTPLKTPTTAPAVPHDKPSSPNGESATPKPPSAPVDDKPEAGAPITKSEPKDKEPQPTGSPAGPTEPAGPFDRAAAAAALTTGAAQASACKKEGDPSGVASVVITFAPSGRVTSANVSGPPFAGTATGGCIAAALRKVHVPPFEGDRVTVSKTIVIQ